MKASPVRARLCLAALALLSLSAATGCTYLKHRGEDFLEIVDIGITASWKPGLAVYADGVSVLPGGISYVDGYFLGWGGGQLGATRHFETCWGLLVVGHETHGWGEFDKDDPDTLNRQFVGALGVPLFPIVQSRPSYMPACVHYLHVLFIGAVANARYMEMVDFVLGLALVDLAGDDGEPLGTWPWRRPASQ
jgi:hypothetical protein